MIKHDKTCTTLYNAKQLQFKVFDLLILPFAWFLKGFKPQIVQRQCIGLSFEDDLQLRDAKPKTSDPCEGNKSLGAATSRDENLGFPTIFDHAVTAVPKHVKTEATGHTKNSQGLWCFAPSEKGLALWRPLSWSPRQKSSKPAMNQFCFNESQHITTFIFRYYPEIFTFHS